MGIATDMRRLSEDIVASYDMRVKVVGGLVKDTHNMLKGFQAGHKEMATRLRASLEKGEAERLKAFNPMMSEIKRCIAEGSAKLKEEIQKEQKDRNKIVADLLGRFAKSHETMANTLKESLEKGETDRLKDFKAMMGGIQRYIQDATNETKGVIKIIQARQDERNKEVLAFLEEFKSERERMAAHWQKLSETMYKRRCGKRPRAEVEVSEEVKSVEEVVEEKPKRQSQKKVVKAGKGK